MALTVRARTLPVWRGAYPWFWAALASALFRIRSVGRLARTRKVRWRGAGRKREGKAQRYHAPAPVAPKHITYLVRFVNALRSANLRSFATPRYIGRGVSRDAGINPVSFQPLPRLVHSS